MPSLVIQILSMLINHPHKEDVEERGGSFGSGQKAGKDRAESSLLLNSHARLSRISRAKGQVLKCSKDPCCSGITTTKKRSLFSRCHQKCDGNHTKQCFSRLTLSQKLIAMKYLIPLPPLEDHHTPISLIYCQ